MPSFFPDLLDEFITPVFLKKTRQKFHFGETQANEFQAVAKEMLPLLRKEAFWERKEAPTGLRLAKSADAVCETVVMSLGAGLDRLQDDYSQKGLLSQSYMLEVLAGELLMRGYGAYNRYMKERLGFYVAAYHFPGGEEGFPLEMLPRMLGEVTGRVTCNAAFCMLPKKSAAFLAELTRDENACCEGICHSCGNTRCVNRAAEDDFLAKKRMAKMADLPLPYGYSRIFGIKRI